ncbi:MAG: hypothetical protein ACRD4C_14865 [Candidatus Acidiferrales bacterium]
MAAIAVVAILVLALAVEWLINILPMERMVKRFISAAIGIVVLLWLIKIFIGFGHAFSWRP